MKIGVIGHTGMVGTELHWRGYEPIACDVTNPTSVRRALDGMGYDAIIYAAGVTDVDACEKDPTDAKMVNVFGVHNVVDVYEGKLIYISTDHVFSGNKFLHGGYTERHKPSPINKYGITKISGEWMMGMGRSDARIIRTSKLFNRKVLVQLQLLQKCNITKEYSTVLKRSFLHVQHFVDGLQFVLDNWDKIPAILNISGTDIMTHFMFHCAIARKFGVSLDLVKARTHYIKELAPRPKRAGLNVSLAKKLGVPLYSAYEGIELL